MIIRFSKKLALLLLIFLLALVLRVYRLGVSFPVFVDEAIYIRWAQVMRAEETLRFLPLSDGKQPLFMWVVIPFLKLVNDPLVAGRLVSVLSGIGTVGLIGLISWFLFRSFRVAFLAAFLVATSPFLVFFDRKALVDSFLSFWGAAVLLLGILLSREPRLDLALLTGMALGGAWLTKSPGQLFFLLLPTVFLSNRSNLTNLTDKTYLVKLFASFVIAWVVGFGLYNILRLGPNFHLIGARNLDYVYSLSEVIKHPTQPLFTNLAAAFQWLLVLLPWPVFLAAAFGLVMTFLSVPLTGLLLALWGIAPIVFQAAIGKVFTARYILFSIPTILLLAAYGISRIGMRSKAVRLAAVLFLAVPILWTSGLLVIAPERAPLPRNERHGYLEEWTSGVGLREIAEYLKARPGNTQILVGTEGFFGTTPDGLQIYLEGRKNIRVVGLAFPINEVPGSLKSALKDNEVYLVVNKSRFAISDPASEGLTLVASYDRPARPDGTFDTLLFLRLMSP